MILLIAVVAAYFLFKKRDCVKTSIKSPTFAIQLFNSLRRHLDVQPALLATAMGVYESGYGTSAGFCNANNVFNISSGHAWKGPTWFQANADDEYDKAGNKKRISQKWRLYASLDSAVDDYISFLSKQNGGRYKKAYAALLRSDSYEFVQELYAAGYFTLAPEKYYAGVSGALTTARAMIQGAV